MDSWVIGQVSFWYTVYETKPAWIVDKVISFWIDLCTPGRGAGQGNWWMQGIRTMEQQTERTRREFDLRSSLRRWDQDYPQIHHELIIRWLCGALASVCCTSIYNSLRRPYPRSYDIYGRR